MVTCQSSELGWEVTVELLADFLSLGRGSVKFFHLSCRSFGLGFPIDLDVLSFVLLLRVDM